MHIKFVFEKSEEQTSFGNVGVTGKIILKLILNKQRTVMWTGFSVRPTDKLL
jgi:hypothetical protein